MGEVKIDDANIVSITLEETTNAILQSGNQQNLLKDPAVMGQVNQLQNKLLADPSTMDAVNNLLENEEIKDLISDPSVIKDILSYDPNKIESNEKIKKLLENTEFQSLLNQIGQNLPQQ